MVATLKTLTIRALKGKALKQTHAQKIRARKHWRVLGHKLCTYIRNKKLRSAREEPYLQSFYRFQMKDVLHYGRLGITTNPYVKKNYPMYHAMGSGVYFAPQ